MKKILFLLLAAYFLHPASAQVSINTTNTAANNSAMLDVTSSNKGVLIPRMTTTQRNAITSPAKGLMVFDSTATSLWYYDGTGWGELSAVNANLWKLNGSDIYNTNTGNVGIGTNTPDATASLHVKTLNSKGFLVTGPTNNASSTPDLGSGSRMMFYPAKGAFRAGSVTGSQWDNSNVAIFSTAMGYNTTASGNFSTAMGAFTTAGVTYSTAMGQNSNASGFCSTAMGWNTIASGAYTMALGYNTTARGEYSTAMGSFTKAKGFASTVVGTFNDSLLVPSETILSYYTPLFIVGNGDADNARTNALVITKNGKVYIDPSNQNSSNLNNALLFGLYNSTGEGIASKRNAGGNQNGLDFYTNSTIKLSITNAGQVQVTNDLIVQNGKGIIRNTDGTQSKKLSVTATVNISLPALSTQAIAVTWPEGFSTTPEAYVGNVTGGSGGWAEVILSVADVTTTGANLYVSNPRGTTFAPNFTVKIIAIGAQ